MSKYVHAMEYANGDNKLHEAAAARRSVHETLQELAKQAQELSRISPALISTTLNIVKTSCESSFEYMQDILYTKSMEWIAVGETIDNMLSFLLKSVRKMHSALCNSLRVDIKESALSVVGHASWIVFGFRGRVFVPSRNISSHRLL